MAAEKKQKKDYTPRYCVECGKEIMEGDEFEHTQTKRWTEIYIHRKCLRRRKE